MQKGWWSNATNRLVKAIFCWCFSTCQILQKLVLLSYFKNYFWLIWFLLQRTIAQFKKQMRAHVMKGRNKLPIAEYLAPHTNLPWCELMSVVQVFQSFKGCMTSRNGPFSIGIRQAKEQSYPRNKQSNSCVIFKKVYSQ